ncbi:glycosyltransferase family 39 protein [Curtobacterium citreum]|uniref:glycosyltransferase family 39 protein n=1 Tax=Curtobacterium citreum TaxID=2036 RepID=UPI002542C907|nr:glycosyltransferase family 39 protein [Curtobacterium citreum]WIJ44224.1 glycosyltransferase family 39 protein [Curtobacterium citreum]
MRRSLPSVTAGIVLAAACFAVLASIAIGFSAPPFNSGDEAAHFDYAVTVWHGHLPVFEDGLSIRSPFGILPPVQWVSQHPPLFYAILAPVVGPLWDGGHLYAAVLAGRAVNAVLAGLTVLASAWAARRVLPARPVVAAVAAVVVAMTPMFLLVGGAVYNDLPNVAFGALAIGVGATAIRRGLSTRLVVLGAVVTAAGMLSRLSAVVFVAVVLVAFLCARGSGRWNRLPGKVLAVAVAAVAPVLAAGWFFLRNRQLTGNIAGSHPEWAAQNLRREQHGFVETVTDPGFWSGVFSVFRGHFADPWGWTWALLVVPLLLAVVVAVVPGLRRSTLAPVRRRDLDPRGDRLADALVALMLVAVFAAVVFLQVRFTMQGGAAQARYGLPVVPVLAVAMAVGLTGLGRIVAPLVVTAWIAVAGYDWFAIVDLSRPAFTAAATLPITRVAVALAVLALAVVVVLTWVAFLRRPVATVPGTATGTGAGAVPGPVATEPLPLVGFVVHGAGGVHPASAHIRVTGRMSALAASGAARVAQVDPVRWADGSDTAHLDAILVQRDAFPLASLDDAFARARAEGTRIVAEVDDDFFSPEARARLARAEYDPERLASVDRLVRSADAVVVSTRALQAVLAAEGVAAVVVPNAVQPGLWADQAVAHPTVPDPTVTGPSAADTTGPRRVLYMGSATHGGDLDLLRPVFDGFTDEDGRPVRLEVVGVTGDDDVWHDRLALPEGASHYPDFVAFLRANAHRWSAGVAPLTDDRFNDAKSDLKFLEYTMLGLPFVGSDRPSYAGVDAHGGLLAGDGPDAWRAALLTAFRQSGERVARARAYVAAERTLGADGPWRTALGIDPA